jgi:hypothetical protein
MITALIVKQCHLKVVGHLHLTVAVLVSHSAFRISSVHDKPAGPAHKQPDRKK